MFLQAHRKKSIKPRTLEQNITTNRAQITTVTCFPTHNGLIKATREQKKSRTKPPRSGDKFYVPICRACVAVVCLWMAGDWPVTCRAINNEWHQKPCTPVLRDLFQQSVLPSESWIRFSVRWRSNYPGKALIVLGQRLAPDRQCCEAHCEGSGVWLWWM